MRENGKIGVRQFRVLVMIFTFSSIMIAPWWLTRGAKQDAWIAAIIGTVGSLLLVWLYCALGNRFPDKPLTIYNEILLGKWLGKIVSFLFSGYFFLLAAMTVRELGDYIITIFLPETPIQAILLMFISLAVMGARMGLEPVVRAAEIFVPAVVLLFILLVVFLIPDMEVRNIQPVLENGFAPVLRSTVYLLGSPYLEFVVFLLVLPYVNRTKKTGRAFWTGTLLGGMALIIITSVAILVLGADSTSRHMYPSTFLTKIINIGDIFQRVEIIIAFIWFLAVTIKLTVFFYASTMGIAQSLNFKNNRFLTFIMGAMLFALSLTVSPNIAAFRTFQWKLLTPLSFAFGLFLPVVLLLLAKFKKRSSK